MDDSTRSYPVLVGRLRHELIQYGLISVYLYVCFSAILLYKMAVLHGQGIGYAPYGLAAIRALILGKFVLVGHAARIGDRYTRRRLVYVILYKSFLFLLLLFTLVLIEEAVTGALRGRTIGASLAGLGGNRLYETLATCLIVLLILIPYIAFREVSAALGEGRLLQLLLEHRKASRST